MEAISRLPKALVLLSSTKQLSGGKGEKTKNGMCFLTTVHFRIWNPLRSSPFHAVSGVQVG